MKKTVQYTKKSKKKVLKKESLKPSSIDVSAISSGNNPVSKNNTEEAAEAALLANFEMSLNSLEHALKADSVNAQYSRYITDMLQDTNVAVTTEVVPEETIDQPDPDDTSIFSSQLNKTNLEINNEVEPTFVSNSQKTKQSNKPESMFLLQREQEKTSLFDKYNTQKYAPLRHKPEEYINTQARLKTLADNSVSLNAVTHVAGQAITSKKHSATNLAGAQSVLASNNASLQRDLSINSASTQECHFYEHAARAYRLRYRLRAGLLTSMGVGLVFIVVSSIINWLSGTTETMPHFDKEILSASTQHLFIAGVFIAIFGAIAFTLYFFFYHKGLAGQTDATIVYTWLQRDNSILPTHIPATAKNTLASIDSSTDSSASPAPASSLNSVIDSLPPNKLAP